MPWHRRTNVCHPVWQEQDLDDVQSQYIDFAPDFLGLCPGLKPGVYWSGKEISAGMTRFKDFVDGQLSRTEPRFFTYASDCHLAHWPSATCFTLVVRFSGSGTETPLMVLRKLLGKAPVSHLCLGLVIHSYSFLLLTVASEALCVAAEVRQ